MISIITGASATGKTFKLQKELKEIYENHEVPVLVVNTFRESIYDDFKPIEIKDINKNLKCKSILCRRKKSWIVNYFNYK